MVPTLLCLVFFYVCCRFQSLFLSIGDFYVGHLCSAQVHIYLLFVKFVVSAIHLYTDCLSLALFVVRVFPVNILLSHRLLCLWFEQLRLEERKNLTKIFLNCPMYQALALHYVRLSVKDWLAGLVPTLSSQAMTYY